MMHRARRTPWSRPRQQRGAVAILFGLMLVMLIGFAALAIDLGRFFVIKSEVQNAVDACALAAASQLRPGQNNPTALIKAVAYGRVFATGGSANIDVIKNRGNFQSDVIAIAPEHITFSPTLNGTYLDSGSANYNTAAYVRCSYPLSGLPTYFMQILDSARSTQTVGATAVATLAPSSSACAIPVGVCMNPGGNAGNNFGLTPGDWLLAKSGNQYGTGNFGWVDFTPPGGGANELANLLNGSGQCDVETGMAIGESGKISSLVEAWNSRFGWYKSGGGGPTLATSPPDFTGYAYSQDTNWPEGRNAYNGTSSVPGAMNFLAARASHQPYQGNTPLGIPSTGYSTTTPANHAAYGRDRRIMVAPVLDCSVWNTNGNAQPAAQGWACVLMLGPMGVGTAKSPEVWDRAMVEYIGLSTVSGSPCATGGEPGTAGPLVPVMAQ